MTLEDLYNELGTMRWVGSDEGWDLAIEAVRKRIREEVETKPTDAFGITDEDIQKAYDKLQSAINKETGTIPLTIGKYDKLVEKAIKQIPWTTCPICGRDEKYSSGLGMSIMHCKYDCTNKKGTKGSSFYDINIQPTSICLFDAIKDWSDTPIMGLACTCPKCSPR